MYTGVPLSGMSCMRLIVVLLAICISSTALANKPPKANVDKVSCPAGYQLVDGTYRVIKGAGVPQKAYTRENTLIVEYPSSVKMQAIAVCARIPL